MSGELRGRGTVLMFHQVWERVNVLFAPFSFKKKEDN